MPSIKRVVKGEQLELKMTKGRARTKKLLVRMPPDLYARMLAAMAIEARTAPPFSLPPSVNRVIISAVADYAAEQESRGAETKKKARARG